MYVEFLTQQNFSRTNPYSSIQRIKSQILKKKALVIFDKEKYIGIISVKDLAKMSNKIVIDSFSKKPPINHDCELTKALDIMLSHDIDVLPVWKDHSFFGLVFKNDIAEYLKIQSHELEKNIQERTAQLENALIKAKESEVLKNSFLGNLSHEIRTPLNGIMGFSNLLMDKELSKDDVKKFAQIINKSSKQLLSIINSVLLMSKLETGLIELTPQEINLNHFLQEILDFFKLQAEKQELELRLVVGLANEKSNILVDDVRLKQIIDNLINNALKFTAKGYVEFGYHIEGNEIKIYVKDTGIGIKSEFHEKIFERFQQVEIDYLKNEEGIGLGLAISKGLIEAMGGIIKIKSKQNKGSEFYFTIPYHPVQITKEIKPKLSKNFDVNPIINKSEFACLLVDDEPINLVLLEELLINSMSVKIFKAHNGKEAIDVCMQENGLTIVLMDLKMPIMDGYEATRRIKKMFPSIKIIAQSAYSSKKEKKAAIAAGCDEFISKPIDLNRLLHVISKYMSN